MDKTPVSIEESDSADKAKYKHRKEVLESLLRSANAPDNDTERMKAIAQSHVFLGADRVASDIAADLYAVMWEYLHDTLAITNKLLQQ
jgi:hypothetical protein